MTQGKIKLGISACLLGQKVRFDSGHKRSHFCADELGKYVEYKAYCPEVAVGLPIPRPTVRLVQQDNVITICRPDGTGDVTDAMNQYGKRVAAQIDELSGYVFCAKSPSCGMERVKVYQPNSNANTNDGIGLFAKAIMQADPLLPCEENGRLNDALLRENFVMRIFVYDKWKKLRKSGLSKGKLIEFHSQHKYLLMSHDVSQYKALGRLLARADMPLDEQSHQYITGLMTGLKKIANKRSHTNTLQHLQGYFKKQLSKAQKAELTEHIDQFRQGNLPLIAPLTLLKHYLREHPKAYLATQAYFEPYPSDLKLRYAY